MQSFFFTMEPKAVDLNNFDFTIKPGDDFYSYVNGGWLKSNPLRDEFSRYGTFDKLIEQNQHLQKSLLKELAASWKDKSGISRKIGCFYSCAVDEKLIEKTGLSPLLPVFKRISSISNKGDLITEIARLHTESFAPLFAFAGSPDEKNSRWMIAHLYQAGLGLPDRDYYTDEDDRMKEIRSQYLIYIEKLHSIAGIASEELSIISRKIMEIETRLAYASMTRLEQRDPHKTYNKFSEEELQKLCPDFDWGLYFNQIGLLTHGDINVNQPAFFTEVNNMFMVLSVDDWKIYLRWNILNSSAPYLHKALVDEHFGFYGTVLSGKKELRPRWKRAIGASDEALGEAIGQIFVKKYFPPDAKQRMLSLVQNLKLTLARRIKQLSWMGPETKEMALEKLSTMKVKIGYPDKWRDFSKMEISEESYFKNVLQSSIFNYEYMLSKINKPVDPDEWHMSPQTVNAYYNPLDNEIVFPAGILQPPFFYKDADEAVNYGAIGVVIGHEMTHGFDDQGRKFDKNGNLTDWWTEEDAQKFNARTEVLVKQFDSFMLLDSLHADGKLTLGENIADLGGLHIAFEALQMALKESGNNPSFDGFTQEQRFFLAYAHIWAQNIRDEEIQRRIKEDEHSLGYLRVIGPLRNVSEFHKAFGVKPGDLMFLNEQDRAVIW
jgi:putative endopeptidase